jgi:meso-butanediol dehydrogenase/(S,S)-butanediol dehydrogenase/diacetyl reductase
MVTASGVTLKEQDMAGYMNGKIVVVIGAGNDVHRGVAVSLAEAGADIAIAGVTADLSAEAALHSISNEIWALGRRSTVVAMAAEDAPGFAEAVQKAASELGRADMVVRCAAILHA